MQLQHAHTETEPVRDLAEADDPRLAQLLQAREEDRLWRAGRKAELERQINRSLVLFGVLVVALTGGTFAAVQVSRPWLTGGGPHSTGTIVWELLSSFLPMGIAIVAPWIFSVRMRPVQEELKYYARDPEEPVVRSSGLVIHAAGSAEGEKCSEPKS